ncbi:50S ribosomal protein L29 [Neoasaia chiangmaiensis NBRC 101099]|uniref:Large ribosomal subunit protein uL29 n=1 Tax=Neoasaia chiangmaiensis TaxID=320497 RepID=A0A1U9KP57_9PROT|nr:50S ribosomal protein L29 [Neoasaia chiangmaiensis]AQS87601.1 50S ribosomal protein L29 [Neoasaia chiangmaiensis]GBR42139.1 50S ribosomal protein L29 [Neoasaia chiangmaiensis NBRC 101099]GEN14162.1 50S ribosomal protein L29 [Neoasaia chiangmaiensis]
MADAYKVADLRAKSGDELQTLLHDLKREQLNLRFQAATGQLEGQGRIRVLRRAIARIKTVAHQSKTSAGAKTSAAKS